MLRYCSLFSGSSGNATYVGTADGGLLIDAGVSAKRIEEALHRRDIDPQTIRAVLVTHEHTDHIAGLRVLCRRYGWPVIASMGTLDALAADDRVCAGQRLFSIDPGQRFAVSGMSVTAFATPHDSRQCLGFRVDGADGVSLALATDMGYVTKETMQAITGCRLIHIESNHDPVMLRNGPYPLSLQKRILGAGGHLSNAACAAALPRLVEAGAQRIVLAHLSEHNNTPALAQSTSVNALSKAGMKQGRDYLLRTASPVGAEPVCYL